MSGCRDLIPRLRELEAGFRNVRGNREYEILDGLAPLPGEPVATKLSASAFSVAEAATAAAYTALRLAREPDFPLGRSRPTRRWMDLRLAATA